ncbi:plasmid IncI1-type surface exclusion protein ExcA [Rouxiella badensis]|jgi:hypothetical protein|uniref:plasmid IncI1-type surface exclusion protein ExcA n=1 Tax=Rouxiella badensis TaxID=1646377 RepID=UPI001787C75F|nr:plasmid IncI1-type surface exclusion protein ExcA [Rouxiella badensis]QOI58016.1 plasmid IncI1-type surface exclusion protein ExcA [Rouxiella badensis subsp. acadiensis]
MVQRERTGYETVKGIVQVLASVFVMPPILFLACYFTISYDHSSPYNGRAEHWKWALLFWILFLTPIIMRLRTVRRRKRTIKGIAAMVEGELYSPAKSNVVTEGWQNYLGVDGIRGTLLYMRMTRDGVYDVVGLDMHDHGWTRVERVGAKIKLYTKIPECPSLEITAPGGENDALKLYDTICAMQHRLYEYKTSFPAWVRQAAQQDQQRLGVHLNAFI